MEKKVRSDWETVLVNEGELSYGQESIAKEFPLTVIVNGEEFATMVCTPTSMRELIIGFLASEGIIRTYSDIYSIHIDEERGFAYVELNRSLENYEHDHSKRFIGSCCGKSRQFYFKSDVQTAKTIVSKLTVKASQCTALMKKLQAQSKHFQETGGVHNAALCSAEDIIIATTDIGRHNALDKVYGHVLENKVPLSDKIIVFSGRISSEVLLKVSKMGVGIVISKSAPTDLALNLATDLGITAIGFARRNKMNIYTHPYRVLETEQLKV